MASPMLGKKIGSLHLRVLPDTTGFWKRLEARLKPMEERTHFTVNVDRARVDQSRIRASINAQLENLKNVEANVKAKVTVDGARVNRTLLRADVQRQLDRVTNLHVDVEARINAATVTVVEATKKMQSIADAHKIEIPAILDRKHMSRMQADFDRLTSDLEKKITLNFDDGAIRERVNNLGHEFDSIQHRLANSIMSPEESQRLHHRLNKINDELNHIARDRETSIQANPFLAWASARLAWLTRTRIVEVIPRVSKAALAKSVTALAALSGARLSFNYLEDFARWVGRIDEMLPRLTFGITGANSVFAMLMGTISGIVGVGDGLAATLPSLLLLPGLLAGAVMSGVALFVALKDSKEQLAELGPSYTNLGKIIKKAFWDEARPAIISLSNSVMPQLERSFDRTSKAIGRFTSSLMKSLGNQLGGGKLEAMFEGLAQGWDIMATGTDAFARAITNLGLVAARYMPGLAQWFVDLSITFDNWLADVAADGRLDQWISESVDAFYSLWDVLAATTGIFQGIWKAAEAGGAGGLRGFADMLLVWEEAVNGAKWQETLTSMFTGANVAMSGLSDGLQRLGDMLHGLREPIEYMMGESGKALGTFLGDISDALNTPAVGKGITTLIDGLARGLAALQPAMGPMSDSFALLIGFIGKLAEAIGPVLADVLSAAAPLFDRILQAVEPLLPILGDALVSAVESIADALMLLLDNVDLVPFVETLADAFVEMVDALLPIIPALGPLIQNLADGLAPILERLPELVGPLADQLADLLGVIAPHLPEILDLVDALLDLAIPVMELAAVGLPLFNVGLDAMLTGFTNLSIVSGSVIRMLADFAEGFQKLLKLDFSGAKDSFANGLKQIPDALPSIMENVTGLIDRSVPKLSQTFERAGTEMPKAFRIGLDASGNYVVMAGNDFAQKWHNNLNLDSTGAGTEAVSTFANGVATGAPNVVTQAETIVNRLQAQLTVAKISASIAGMGASDGFASGITASLPTVSANGALVASSLGSALTGASYGAGMAGSNATGEFAAGINARSVDAVLAGAAVAVASVNALKQQSEAATAAGVLYGANLALGLMHATVIATIAAARLRGTVENTVAGLGGSGVGIGVQFGNGIAVGILATVGRVAAAAAAIAASAMRAARSELDIHSPSRRARDEIGLQLGLGMGLGIEDSRKSVEKSMRSLTDSMHANAPELVGAGVASGLPGAAAGGSTHFTFVNPVVRDDFQDAWDDAQEKGGEL